MAMPDPDAHGGKPVPDLGPALPRSARNSPGGGISARVPVVFSGLVRAPHVHVLDLFGRDAGPLRQRFEGNRGRMIRPNRAGGLTVPAYGGAYRLHVGGTSVVPLLDMNSLLGTVRVLPRAQPRSGAGRSSRRPRCGGGKTSGALLTRWLRDSRQGQRDGDRDPTPISGSRSL